MLHAAPEMEPAEGVENPAVQGVQVREPAAAAYDPAAQALHPAAFATETVPAKPALHTEQSAAPAFGVEKPVAQRLQAAVPPAAAYVPTIH